MKTEVVVDKVWAKPENEEALMKRLHQIISGSGNGPFGPRAENEGYRWQLDASNDWWAQFNRGEERCLIIAYRYANHEIGMRRLMALANFVQEKFGGNDFEPPPWKKAEIIHKRSEGVPA